MRIRRVLIDRSGSALVIAGVGLAAILGMLALALDLGMLFTAKADAQKAADAAALAGASAFIDAGNSQTVAAERASFFAQQNSIINQAITGPETSVTVDVNALRVSVLVSRPNVQTWFANFLTDDAVGVGARATARAVDVNQAICVRPFSPPDPLTKGGSEYSRGQLVQLSGWAATGAAYRLMLPSNDGWDGTCDVSAGGADPSAQAFIRNTCKCNQATLLKNAVVDKLPGNKNGPEKSGIEQLVATDPGAWWNTATKQVEGSMHANWMESPRVIIIPLHNASKEVEGSVPFTRFIRVFVEPWGSGPARGRFIGALRTLQLVN